MKSINDLQNISFKQDIINGLFKYKGLYVLVAAAKAGKSLLALQISNSVTNGLPFLNMKTMKSPIFYISTELSEEQLSKRIKQTGYQLLDGQFFYLVKNTENKLDIKNDLLLELKESSEEYNGSLVIIDMMAGISYGSSYDLNSYTEISNIVMDTYRTLINKFNLTFLLIHHLNKNGKALGSTGIEGFVDGILYLNDKGDNKYILKISSRDFESKEINLSRKDNLEFEVIEEEVDELDINLNTFLKYVIKEKEVSFTPSEIVSKLNLMISPTKFGILINNNLKRLEQEGIYISKNKTAQARNYKAIFIDPMNIN